MREQLGDQRPVRFGQTSGGPTAGTSAERISPAEARPPQPLAHGRLAHPEGFGDPDGLPTLLAQLEGSNAASLEPILRLKRIRIHARPSYGGRC